jgi:hypothetical protein
MLVAFALAGCGGDDSGSADTPSSTATESSTATRSTESTESTTDPGTGLSKADFVAAANGICSTGNQAIAAGAAQVDPTDPNAVDAFAQTVLVPSVRSQIEGIRSLGFPAGDEDLLDGILTDAGAALDDIEADPSLLARVGSPFAPVNEALTSYGLTECASS